MNSRRPSYRRPTAPSAAAAPHSHLPDSSLPGISDLMTRNALQCAVAQDTLVTVSDGTVFQGVFSGTESVSGELFLVMRYVRVVSGNKSKINEASERRGNMAQRLRIPVGTLVRMDASPIPTRPRGNNAHNSASHGRGANNRGPRQESRGFATDGQISGRVTHGPGRELQRFDDFADISATGPSRGVKGNADVEAFGDLAAAPRSAKWDQFQANESQFGVHTSFNEDEYTTKIDRSSADFHQRQRDAARLAAEIEKKSTSNIHQQEERNQPVTANFDEEDRYSGVLRSGQVQSAATAARQGAPFGKQGVPSAKFANAAKSGTPSTKMPNKQGPASTKHISGPAKPAPAKSGPPAAKPGAAPVKHGAVPAKQNPVPAKQKPAPNGVPARAKIHPQQKLSYAAAAGAKQSQPAPAPAAASVPSPVSESSNSFGPRPSPSPMSPSKPSSGTKTPPAPPAISRLPPRTRETGQNARASNGGRTPPSHGRSSPIQSRNSPLSPNNPETSAVAALDLEATTPKIGPAHVKSFEQYKAEKKLKSLAENRQTITNDLKKFSNDLDVRKAVPRRNSGAHQGSATATAKNDGRQSHAQKGGPKHQKANSQMPPRENVAVAAVSVPHPARAAPKQPIAAVPEAPKAQVPAVVAATSNGSMRTSKGKVTEGMTSAAPKKTNVDFNDGTSSAESGLSQPTATSSAPVPTAEPATKGGQAAQQGSTSAKPKKTKVKLNPNATAWQPPTAAAAPPPPASVPPGPMTQAQVPMDAYFQPMGSFAPVSTGMSEHQPAPGMPYPMAPAPLPHPSNMSGYPQQPYPVMMPGGMPAMPQAGYGYMPGPRGAFMVPGSDNRFPPAAPPAGMGFGIPVSMMPPQGNQRNPGYQFFNGQGYLPAQPPMHQPGMPPAYGSHHGMPAPGVAMPPPPPRNSMGSGRRGGAKGRGRQHHGHQQHHGHGHGYSGGYGGNDPHQGHHQGHHQQSQHAPHHGGQFGGQGWFPVVHDGEKGEGAPHEGAPGAPQRRPAKGGVEQGTPSGPGAPQQ